MDRSKAEMVTVILRLRIRRTVPQSLGLTIRERAGSTLRAFDEGGF
jgi:hypothetical protein